MIRKTLDATRRATFCVELPVPHYRGLTTPTGTGFFVSPDGWFVTAAHVITVNNLPDGPPRTDLTDARLTKEMRPDVIPTPGCDHLELACVIAEADFALLKVPFNLIAEMSWLEGATGFPFLQVSARVLDEGEPVYAFGYPLSDTNVLETDEQGLPIAAHSVHSPRTTSGIVAAQWENTGAHGPLGVPPSFVLDRALNYGNSGGPILATETGYVHALCSRFQPLNVYQKHVLHDGHPLRIEIPSLYGVVANLGNELVVRELKKRNISVFNSN